MADIYEQHRAAFASVSAFVILDGAERVATVAIKFPRDGAGRLYAYVHWIGTEMVRGFANGFGYDKRTAACSSAAKRMKPAAAFDNEREHIRLEMAGRYEAFRAAMLADTGMDWTGQLRAAGFTVLQAV